MLIPLLGTSQNLFDDILTDAQKEVIKSTKNGNNYSNIIIQNRSVISTEAIYLSFGEAAAIGTSLKIELDATLGFQEIQLKDVNIVSESGGNNIIIEFN